MIFCFFVHKERYLCTDVRVQSDLNSLAFREDTRREDICWQIKIGEDILQNQTQSPSNLPSPLVVTINEACELTRLGRSMVYQLIRSGELESVKFGRARRVSMASIESLIGRSNPI